MVEDLTEAEGVGLHVGDLELVAYVRINAPELAAAAGKADDLFQQFYAGVAVEVEIDLADEVSAPVEDPDAGQEPLVVAARGAAEARHGKAEAGGDKPRGSQLSGTDGRVGACDW